MTSDDVTAWAAISLGAAASLAVSVLLLTPDPSPRPSPSVLVEVWPAPRAAPLVDFAIIRGPGGVEIMVGPEAPSTGWLLPKRFELHELEP